MSSPRTGTLTQEDIEEALYGGDLFRPDDSSSSSSNTNTTIRGNTGTSGRSPVIAFNSPKTNSILGSVAFSSCLQGRSVRLSPVRSPVSETLSSSGSGSVIRVSPTSKDLPETLSIHFRRPPGSARVRKGPFSLEELQSYLGLKDDSVSSMILSEIP